MKEKITEQLKSAGITKKKLLKIRGKMLNFLSEKQELPKVNQGDKEKIKILKDFYKNKQEQNSMLSLELFSQHKKLLDSKNLKIQIEALKELEKLAKKYEIDLYGQENNNEVIKTEKKRKPSVILKHRHKIKSQLERKLPPKDKYGTRGDAIIKDMSRIDSYPNIDEKPKGISSWFKVEIKKIYHSGLEVFLTNPKYIIFNKKKKAWKFAKDNAKNKVLGFPVARIPFENIREINWRGDEYYNCPHIYCDFKNGQPYESIVFYIERGSDENKYLFLVEGFEPYK